MPWKTGFETAIARAVEKLRGVDLVRRCELLGLPAPRNNTMALRAFGHDLRLTLPDFELRHANSGQKTDPIDHILFLHYLLCDLPLHTGGDLVSFSELAGGQFYRVPFLQRTVRPLVRHIGNNLHTLRQNLDQMDWQPVNPHNHCNPDELAARIHAFGKIHLTLIYRTGDEEFPADADILFDPCIKRVFGAEDAAVLASRVCGALKGGGKTKNGGN